MKKKKERGRPRQGHETRYVLHLSEELRSKLEKKANGRPLSKVLRHMIDYCCELERPFGDRRSL